MKNRILLLIAFALLALAGCEKDPLKYEEEQDSWFPNAKSFQKSLNNEGCASCGPTYTTLNDFPALKAHILAQLQLAEPESRYYAQVLEGTVMQQSWNGTTTYTIFWQTEGSSIFKLFVETDVSGAITQMGVLEITADPQFLASYFQGTARLSDFEGEARVITLEEFFRAKRSGSVKSGNRTKNFGIEDCLRLIFVNGGPVGGNGGGIGDPGGTGFPDNKQAAGCAPY